MRPWSHSSCARRAQECARDAEQKLWTGLPRAKDVFVAFFARFDRGGDGIRWKSYDPVSGRVEYRAYEEACETARERDDIKDLE